MKLVDDRIRHTRVVKYLSANFLRAFYGAGIAGQRGDFGSFMSGLIRAAELFEHIMPEVRAALEELPRRERAHKLFLRNLGHGGVSAFALTEPTAGSDSGGVKTMAVLRTAMLSPLPDGRYVFSPTGELDKSQTLPDRRRPDRLHRRGHGLSHARRHTLAHPVRPLRLRHGRRRAVLRIPGRGLRVPRHRPGPADRRRTGTTSSTASRARRCGSPTGAWPRSSVSTPRRRKASRASWWTATPKD